ncbi:hypothetical protein HU200_007540 [Digitaria exilis]|uniref:Leucine-rich repeat-containing N-terminal plant-type domain-containing protein n=1 Tax=Digitaria exilis TaxID=1010633 RepID=A0A835KSF3_9POAL|nr:hypothetical protein HU200_007540 [Digitaria exilis]
MELVITIPLVLLHACILSPRTAAAPALRHHQYPKETAAAEALLQWKSTLLRAPPSLLSSWRPGTTPCTSNWTGISCTTTTTRHGGAAAVTGISLPHAGIDGHLGELNFSALPSLHHLDLSYNSLHGEIPAAIFVSLPALYYLDLSANWLHGDIPPEIAAVAVA